MSDTGFKYYYSASENEEVKRIRNKYIPTEENKLDILKQLDRKVQNAGIAPALVIGILGCLIFGLGMCMALKAVSGGILFGTLLGVLGTAVMLTAYPICRHIFNKTKSRLAPKILELTNELLNNKN